MNKRIMQTLRLWTILSSSDRVEYMKKHKIFGAIGENCSIMDRKVPLYAKLIKLGNNVHIASHVSFITHDIIHVMLNNISDNENAIQENVQCIEIMNNVFIGSNTTILGGVRIGNNVVVGAGSLVNKDIPDNAIVAGVPAKVLGNFDDFCKKRKDAEKYPVQPIIGRDVPDELCNWLWERFLKEKGR